MADVHGESFRLQSLADEGSGLFFVFNDQYAHKRRLAVYRQGGEQRQHWQCVWFHDRLRVKATSFAPAAGNRQPDKAQIQRAHLTKKG
jgi:hypothetical protein